MRKLVLIVLNTVALLAVASLAFAAELDGVAIGLSTLGITLGIGIASLGCGLAQSFAIKAACEGIARNPEAGDKISQKNSEEFQGEKRLNLFSPFATLYNFLNNSEIADFIPCIFELSRKDRIELAHDECL